MKLFCHYSATRFSNCYLLGPEEGGNALLVDPGSLDSQLLQLIENNQFYVNSILITHAHENHVKAVKTLLKIYDAKLYGSMPYVYSFPLVRLYEKKTYSLSGFSVEIFEIPGHSADSVIYRIEDLLFTGDVLLAGGIGLTPNSYTRNLMINTLKNKILTLPEKTMIFPGHGPVTTLKAEKSFNPYFS